MKKNIAAEDRPGFTLMKLSGAISYFHMQMPRWLFCDPRYMDMGLESKVAYTFLLNRYQLSRRNGWVNRHGEVYIIYTREDLARELQVSYRKAIACFKELADRRLVWEQRQGRGLPNRIFLAEVVLDEKAAYGYDCAPFCPTPRPAEIAYLDEVDEGREQEPSGGIPDNMVENMPDMEDGAQARPAKAANQELQKTHTSKKEKSKKEYRDTDDDLPTVPRAGAEDGREAIAAILQRCELSRYAPEEAEVFRDAVSWLYYCGRLQLGACTYPQGYVRDTLRRLDADVLDEALYRLRRNENEAISNTLVYTAKVIFSTIVEMGSEALLDPVLNQVKRRLAT
ncbi:Replication initiator protein A (RepA) N-terminus [uncultured Butyricicoccus sp.]|uniref:Replication initiator protein A n=1 Tax=Agathobaculum ammoniilyticum TaxID=2981778 RepID=A0ABT2U781_9FIRM|nr:replication initiator protein A [Agathobaculum ammoniilyticum]MCU6790475.1 replication initiator protein A [Agathobaculum ammoniilyticum]SCJ63746.1 Replication initiator protein A (RepA) N-terminus [uncultured Butyricicoccus sp.]